MEWISQVEAIREGDAYAMERLKMPGLLLMEAAARSVMERLLQCVGKEDKVLVLCGTGNNGGDGFAIARMLRAKGISVRVFLLGSTENLKGDAKTNFDMLAAQQISVFTQRQASVLEKMIDQSDWIVDAMLGTGLDREVDGFLKQVILYVNKMRHSGQIKVMAVDIPSGVAGNSGQVLGCAVEADETVTFCRLKPGLVLFPGCDYAGRVTVANIGIPENIPPFRKPYAFRLEGSDLPQILPQRQSRSHKGLYGHLLVIAGSRYMTGAAVFSGRSAYRVGTGLVEIALPKEATPIVQSSVPEAIFTAYDETSYENVIQKAMTASAVLIGPGLGRGEVGTLILKNLLTELPESIPLVMDADALNDIAADENLQQLCYARKGAKIITPHMGEASRLLNKPIEEVVTNPMAAVTELSERYGCTAALKDAMTIVRSPEGELFFNSTGNNGMSTAGSGDVLAGMIGGLLAEGLQAFKAAYAGVYLHGAAGDLAKEQRGAYGMTASDIIEAINLEKIAEMVAKKEPACYNSAN